MNGSHLAKIVVGQTKAKWTSFKSHEYERTITSQNYISNKDNNIQIVPVIATQCNNNNDNLY